MLRPSATFSFRFLASAPISRVKVVRTVVITRMYAVTTTTGLWLCGLTRSKGPSVFGMSDIAAGMTRAPVEDARCCSSRVCRARHLAGPTRGSQHPYAYGDYLQKEGTDRWQGYVVAGEVREFSLKENITIGTQCTNPLCWVNFERHWRSANPMLVSDVPF